MSLQEKIKSDLKDSMKAKDEARTSAIRVVLGEFSRQPKKELDDQEVIACCSIQHDGGIGTVISHDPAILAEEGTF